MPKALTYEECLRNAIRAVQYGTEEDAREALDFLTFLAFPDKDESTVDPVTLH